MQTVQVELTFDEISLLLDSMISAADNPEHTISIGEAEFDSVFNRLQTIKNAHVVMMSAANNPNPQPFDWENFNPANYTQDREKEKKFVVTCHEAFEGEGPLCWKGFQSYGFDTREEAEAFRKARLEHLNLHDNPVLEEEEETQFLVVKSVSEIEEILVDPEMPFGK